MFSCCIDPRRSCSHYAGIVFETVAAVVGRPKKINIKGACALNNGMNKVTVLKIKISQNKDYFYLELFYF